MLTCKFSEFGFYCRKILLEAVEKVGITGTKEWLDDPNNGLKEVNFRFDDHMTRFQSCFILNMSFSYLFI